MSQDRRNIINTVMPIFLGFALTVIAGVVSSYLITRDDVNANTQEVASLVKYKALVESHITEFQLLSTRTSVSELKIKNLESNNEDFKEVLRRNNEILERVNITLTTVSVGHSKELEAINKRLDKAGL